MIAASTSMPWRGILCHEGIYYWFGEHKIEGEAGNNAEVGVHVYSSSDLHHWWDDGIALAVSDDATSEIARGCILERPKVLYNGATRQFVMWFHLELKGHGYSAARCGVAVATRATGPYRFVHSFRPDAGAWPENVPDESKKPLDSEAEAQLRTAYFPGNEVPLFARELLYRRDFAGGQMARDMTLFQDDDGSAYVIYASEENGTLHLSQLSDDYLITRGRYNPDFSRPFQRGARVDEAGRPLFSLHFRLHRLGTEPPRVWPWLIRPGGPWRDLGQPVPRRRKADGDDVRSAVHFHPAGRGRQERLHLHGRPMGAQERHRRPLRLASGAIRSWRSIPRMAGELGLGYFFQMNPRATAFMDVVLN